MNIKKRLMFLLHKKRGKIASMKSFRDIMMRENDCGVEVYVKGGREGRCDGQDYSVGNHTSPRNWSL